MQRLGRLVQHRACESKDTVNLALGSNRGYRAHAGLKGIVRVLISMGYWASCGT